MDYYGPTTAIDHNGYVKGSEFTSQIMLQEYELLTSQILVTKPCQKLDTLTPIQKMTTLLLTGFGMYILISLAAISLLVILTEGFLS